MADTRLTIAKSRFERILGRRTAGGASTPPADLRSIRERLNALEAMVEALQDSVDRQASRYDDRMDELARQLRPGELARVLSDDARKRGL
jgi:hypothetical protein